MLKNIVQLESIIADKAYHLLCEPDAPLPHVKEALMKFIYYVGQIEEQALAQQKAIQEKEEAEKAQAPVEETLKAS